MPKDEPVTETGERMTHNHGTVKLRCPWDDNCPIDIDAKLAPLIEQIWRLRIQTNQCCEEYRPGLASIEFPGTGEAREFLFIAQKDYHTELERWDEGETVQRAINLRLLVIFPTADIPRLVKAFATVEHVEDSPSDEA
jgi:hypothetical protein